MQQSEVIDIQVENVTMKFKMLNEKIDSLKEFILQSLKNNIRYKYFSALKSVSFNIRRGERIGIIGHNGAGKSTLLKIISGVMKPTEGRVVVNGSIAPLLELGAGFDQDLTGIENIYLNAAILGCSKKLIDSRLDEIIAYADIGDFISAPVKNYSSGMRARLGFSIAVHIDPDILIVDEILSVGDEIFRNKSKQSMLNLMNSGKTVIVVSHNLRQIQELTEKVLWLDHGELRGYGDAKYICHEYMEYLKKVN
jgi:ABC-type polysaccharide/polyol phosphate transport system ATPase subunit